MGRESCQISIMVLIAGMVTPCMSSRQVSPFAELSLSTNHYSQYYYHVPADASFDGDAQTKTPPKLLPDTERPVDIDIEATGALTQIQPALVAKPEDDSNPISTNQKKSEPEPQANASGFVQSGSLVDGATLSKEPQCAKVLYSVQFPADFKVPYILPEGMEGDVEHRNCKDIEGTPDGHYGHCSFQCTEVSEGYFQWKRLPRCFCKKEGYCPAVDMTFDFQDPSVGKHRMRLPQTEVGIKTFQCSQISTGLAGQCPLECNSADGSYPERWSLAKGEKCDCYRFCEESAQNVHFDLSDSSGDPLVVRFHVPLLRSGEKSTLNCNSFGAPDNYSGSCKFQCPKKGGSIKKQECSCTKESGNSTDLATNPVPNPSSSPKRRRKEANSESPEAQKPTTDTTDDDGLPEAEKPTTPSTTSTTANTTTSVTTPPPCAASSHHVTFRSFDSWEHFNVEYKLAETPAGQNNTLNCDQFDAPKGYVGECIFECPEAGGAFIVPTASKTCQCMAGCERTRKKVAFPNLKEIDDGKLLARLPEVRFDAPINERKFDWNCNTHVQLKEGETYTNGLKFAGSCFFTCDINLKKLGKWVRDTSQNCTCTYERETGSKPSSFSNFTLRQRV